MRLSQLTSLLLLGSLAAQSYTVSPVEFTNWRGSSNNTYPFWWTGARYQQIHGDMTGTPKVLTGMTFRRSQFSAAARTMTLTINLGNSSYAARSTTFASNFIGTPTTVLPKGPVSFPDWTTSSGNTPEPWTASIVFTTPFVYTGVNDLCWEFLVDGNSTTASYPTDAHGSGSNMYAALVQLGKGCLTGTNTLPMTQTMNVTTNSSTGNLNFGGGIARGPSAAAAVMIVGIVNLDLTIPGLCEKLFPFQHWAFNFNLANSGSGTMTTVSVAHDLNWVGQKLYAQTAALDASQTGIPIALSNGNEITLPPFAPAPLNVCRIYEGTSSSATTGTVGSNYGLIVRWTH